MPLSKTITIKRTDGIDLDFPGLIALLNQEVRERYGATELVYDKYSHIKNLGTVVIAYCNGIAAGCGCFEKFNNYTVEIKRMFVKTTERRQGIASIILSELETWAKEEGFSRAILETGLELPESIVLYKKAGYTPIPNYGQYIGMAISVCMGKEL